jgi:biopolymer transport protein ExbD
MSKWTTRKIETEENITPNLIPLVDIMFLMLLFLMLGADMGQRELEDVILPQAIYVKEDKGTKDKQLEDRLTVNVYHRYATGVDSVKCENYAKGKTCRDLTHWRIAVRGMDFKTAEDEKFKALLKTEALVGKKDASDRISERKVMLRIDGSAPYGLAQSIMNACAFAGIYKVESGAAKITAEKK